MLRQSGFTNFLPNTGVSDLKYTVVSEISMRCEFDELLDSGLLTFLSLQMVIV